MQILSWYLAKFRKLEVLKTIQGHLKSSPKLEESTLPGLKRFIYNSSLRKSRPRRNTTNILKRLELKYQYQRFSVRNIVDRFFRYLKERTIILYHELSVRNHKPQSILKPTHTILQSRKNRR